jgi:hypothetical protein
MSIKDPKASLTDPLVCADFHPPRQLFKLIVTTEKHKRLLSWQRLFEEIA